MEQNALLDVLRLVDEQDAWPSFSTEQTLREQWAQATLT